MTPVPEPPTGPYVVLSAWYCRTCDVQGRSLPDAEVACWNCEGQVTVTARPSIRLYELDPSAAPAPAGVAAASVAAGVAVAGVGVGVGVAGVGVAGVPDCDLAAEGLPA